MRTRSHRYNFADLHNGFAGVIFALICDQFRSGGGEGGIELQHGLEVQVADGVMVGGRPGREGSDAAIDFDADEAVGQKKPARQHEMRTEVVIPVEGGPGVAGYNTLRRTMSWEYRAGGRNVN